MNSLDQLRGMHLPAAPGVWPPAPGWWFIAALLMAVLGVMLWRWHRSRRINAYRREALRRAADIETARHPLLVALQLVRRTAYSADVASEWPSLPAVRLLERLDDFNRGRLATSLFAGRETAGLSTDSFQILCERIYSSEPPALTEGQRRELMVCVKRWIRHHQRSDLC